MGTPLCRRPSRGILGSMIWRQKRRQALSRGGRESYRSNLQPSDTSAHKGSVLHVTSDGEAGMGSQYPKVEICNLFSQSTVLPLPALCNQSILQMKGDGQAE